ncbi:MAG: HAD family hydrolase [Bacillota bacterium]
MDALVTFDLDGVLMRNPFRRGVFPHVVRTLEPYASATAAGQTGADPEAVVLQLIIDEARQRLLEGRIVEAYDWDDIVARVAVDLASRAEALEAQSVALSGSPSGVRPITLPGVLPEIPRFDIAALVRHYCTVPGMIARLEGAYEALDALKSAGYTLAVVTNGYLKYQAPVLEALGLADFFSAIITPEQAKAAKPKPGIFHMAWTGWRERDNPPIHVGDDIIHDAWGAKTAGGYSIWLRRDIPGSLRSLLPEDRPRAADFASIRDAAFRTTMAADAYGASPQDCQPDALICALGELPEFLDRLKYRDT